MRQIYHEGELYIHRDDLAAAILGISDDILADRVMLVRDRVVASHTAERIGLSILGANISQYEITAEDIGGNSA